MHWKFSIKNAQACKLQKLKKLKKPLAAFKEILFDAFNQTSWVVEQVMILSQFYGDSLAKISSLTSKLA